MKKDFWNELGDLYLKANAVDAAIESYQKAIQQGYQSSVVYINLAGAYMRQGHIVESIQLYQKSISLLSSDTEKAFIYTKIGDCYRRLQDFDSAIQSFRMAIDLEPGNPRLIEGLVQVQLDLENLYSLEEFDPLPVEVGSPIPELTNVVVLDQAVAETESRLDLIRGSEEISQEEIPTAEHGLDASAEIIPELFSAELPAQIAENGVGADFAEELEVVPSSVPEDAGTATDRKNIEPAIIQEITETVFQDVSLLKTGFETVEPDSGNEIISDQNEFEVNPAEIPEKDESVRVTMLLTLGIMYWRNENLEEASRILQSAIEGAVKINNSWIEALSWNALALVKTAMADVIGAIHAYLRAVELAPDQIFPWNNVGTLYSNLGSSDQALNSFHKAIGQNPENPASWDGLGDIYTRLGRFEDAIAAYQLGNVFGGQAKGSDAIKSYEKAFSFYNFTLKSFESETPAIPVDQPEKDQFLQAETENENLQPEVFVTVQLEPEPAPAVSIDTDQSNGLLDDPSKPLTDEIKEAEPVLSKAGEVEKLTSENDESGDASVDITEDIPPVVETSSAERPIDEYRPTRSIQVRDKRSVPVVSLYEQFVEAKNETKHNQAEQSDREEQIFSSNTAGKVSGLFVEEIPAFEGNLNQSAANDETPSLTENLLPAGQDISFGNVPTLETEMNLPDDQGSNPDIGMLPIVSVEPTPRPEVNRVAVTIATYEATVRENPYNDRAWDSLGNLYRIVQRNKDAIRAFERAVALEPTKYVYHYQLGTLYASEGNFEKAIKEIQTVVDLNPDFTFAHCALASYLRRVGQDDEAQRHIAIASPFMKNEKEYDRACFESIRGNVEGALDLLEIALEKKQTTIEWIQRDLDLDFIRQDPRYRLLTNKSAQSVVGYK